MGHELVLDVMARARPHSLHRGVPRELRAARSCLYLR